MRGVTERSFLHRCRACWLRREVCLCRDVQRVRLGLRVRVLRHAKERWRTSNTARIAALVSDDIQIEDYGGKVSFDPGSLSKGAWLVFPGRADLLTALPTELVVLDGSWAQTRHMIQQVPALFALPRLSFDAPEVAPRRLRRSPREGALSTIEAIAAAARAIRQEGAARALDDAHALFVARTLQLKGVR